jgi:hypothetical protein
LLLQSVGTPVVLSGVRHYNYWTFVNTVKNLWEFFDFLSDCKAVKNESGRRRVSFLHHNV